MATGDNAEDVGAGLTLSSMVKEIQGLKDKFKREDMDSRAYRLDGFPRRDLFVCSFTLRRS